MAFVKNCKQLTAPQAMHTFGHPIIPCFAHKNVFQNAAPPSALHRRNLLHFPLVICGTAALERAPQVAQAAVCVEQACEESPVFKFDAPVTLQRPITDTFDPPTYVTATGRIVAIGDLHGDMAKTIEAFEVAGVMTIEDGKPVWIGGDTVVVQLGDVLDRGDYEIAIVMLLRELDRQARLVGGAVYMLNGNHESLNVALNFRYVTRGAWVESALVAGVPPDEPVTWEQVVAARVALYQPGGDMAKELSKNPTVLVVNDTAFAHGGLLPLHVRHGVDRINREVAEWMRGAELEDGSRAAPPFIAMGDGNSVMWNRTLSGDRWSTPVDKYHTCSMLSQALEAVNAKRLVVGHTPQMKGANCECNGKVWRIDVGMSSGVRGAEAQVLEILPAPPDGECTVKVLSTSGEMNNADVEALGFM